VPNGDAILTGEGQRTDVLFITILDGRALPVVHQEAARRGLPVLKAAHGSGRFFDQQVEIPLAAPDEADSEVAPPG
jgi:hypothetical protein